MSARQQKLSAKDKILDAALMVIRAKGYTATTVDDLCAASDVTKGAFFHHFKSKDDLAIAAADHWSEMTSELFAAAPYHTHPEPLDRVLGYIDFRKTILTGTVGEFTCLVGTMVQETYDSHPAISRSLRPLDPRSCREDRGGYSRRDQSTGHQGGMDRSQPGSAHSSCAARRFHSCESHRWTRARRRVDRSFAPLHRTALRARPADTAT